MGKIQCYNPASKSFAVMENGRVVTNRKTPKEGVPIVGECPEEFKPAPAPTEPEEPPTPPEDELEEPVEVDSLDSPVDPVDTDTGANNDGEDNSWFF